MNIGTEVLIGLADKQVDIDESLVESVVKSAEKLFFSLHDLGLDKRMDAVNRIREVLHEHSPMRNEPVDFVRWVKSDRVVANDYNPNKVAPPEMKLLELSIINDGYTQPIVSWSDPEKDSIEVIDGFHRNRVGRESLVIQERVQGYLPIVDIRTEQSSKNDRMASTIRHNRARGKHQVDAMSGIVTELKNRNWRNARIAKELGMDEEEVLRLCQISGLESLFTDRDFSRSWEADDAEAAYSDWEDVSDEITEEEIALHRIPHQDKTGRIFHTYDKWECEKAGFYRSNVEGKTATECKVEYRDFLSDSGRFRAGANNVINNWPNSCEHYLTNFAMNRIAWMGQAAMCIETGIPSKYCSGFSLLTDEQKEEANLVALDVINDWMLMTGRDTIEMGEADGHGRQVEIY